MATTNITVTITTPTGVTVAEAVRLFSEARGYTAESGMTRAEYAKSQIAFHIREVIRSQQAQELSDALEVTRLSTVIPDITVS
jgi:phosphotransferase system HPr-like phosphotransfer protein